MTESSQATHVAKRARVDTADTATPEATPAIPIGIGASLGASPEVEFRPESIFDGLTNDVQWTRLQPGSPEFNAIIAPMNATPGFNSIAVFAINNPDVTAHFHIQSASIARQNGGNANIISGYHCTSTKAVRVILENGFNIALSRFGFFGKGADFAKSVVKANDSSPKKGNPNATRLMLICDVALGKPEEFEIGRFDRELVNAPEGCHSVCGFTRRDYEYVVYNQNQVCPRYLVFYTFTNTALEMEKPTNIPPNVKGQVVFITPVLSEFFGKLQKCLPMQELIIKRLIGCLLRQDIDVSQFIHKVSTVLGASPPASLEGSLNAELIKCKLPAKKETGAISTRSASTTTVDVASTDSVSLAPDSTMQVVPTISASAPVSTSLTLDAASALLSIGYFITTGTGGSTLASDAKVENKKP